MSTTDDDMSGSELDHVAPLSGADLDRWTAALGEDERSVAAVAGGVDPSELEAWVRNFDAAEDGSDALARPSWVSRFHSWDAPPHVRARPPAHLVEPWTWLARPFSAESGYHSQPPPLRLLLRGNIIPTEVVPKLLACPRVGSAVIPVERPPGALRRRELSWPLRIGVLSDDLLAAFVANRGAEGVPPKLVDVSDPRTDPGLADILIIRQPPEQAATSIAETRSLASMVVCLADRGDPWPVVDAHLALIRAVTAASANVLVPADNPDAVVRGVLRAVRFLSHGHPVDVAITSGFDDDVVIAGEVATFVDATVPNMIRRQAEQFSLDYAVLEEVNIRRYQAPDTTVEELRLPGVRWLRTLDQLDVLADNAFENESDAAMAAPELREALDAALDKAAEPRLLQAYVGAPCPNTVPDNILRPGENAINIFIGPWEAGALEGPEFPDAEIFGDPTINQVTLTAVLAPLQPRVDPVRTELVVPRVGRSRDARLTWNVPDVSQSVQARIVIMYHNRVIQTALIGGTIGEPARLTERLVLWQTFNRLDDRQRFDRAFILNHDAADNAALISHANGITTVDALPELNAITGRIRASLLRAITEIKKGADGASDAARSIFIDAAAHGRDLFRNLEDYLYNFSSAKRIQVVAARPGWFLPLELIYDRPAPDPDATLCKNWVARSECGKHCFQDDEDDSVVCPSVFWGMSRVIERHQAQLTDPNGTAFLLTTEPTRNRRTLTLTHAALAASGKVGATDVKNTSAKLPNPTVAATWPAWKVALKHTATDLLVLMPHTDSSTTALEISPHPKGPRPLREEDIRLKRGQLEKKYVTGGRDVTPFVVLFGCDTAGFEDDPSGYAGTFMKLGAGVVISTLTMLLNRHAAEMSQLLAATLFDVSRPEEPVGDLVAKFRRDAVRAGLISALAVAAYGDADWKV
jgi:hypothetical protein